MDCQTLRRSVHAGTSRRFDTSLDLHPLRSSAAVTSGESYGVALRASGCFRPDAALLPLLPLEDHPTCCDCEACTRDLSIHSRR
jgi:hypothetical protein